MRILIIFIFLLSNSFATEISDIKNIVINDEPKKYNSLTFFDAENKQLDLENYKLNFTLLVNFSNKPCLVIIAKV